MDMEELRAKVLEADPLADTPEDITVEGNVMTIRGRADESAYQHDMRIEIIPAIRGFHFQYRSPGTTTWSAVIYCPDYERLHTAAYML